MMIDKTTGQLFSLRAIVFNWFNTNLIRLLLLLETKGSMTGRFVALIVVDNRAFCE